MPLLLKWNWSVCNTLLDLFLNLFSFIFLLNCSYLFLFKMQKNKSIQKDKKKKKEREKEKQIMSNTMKEFGKIINWHFFSVRKAIKIVFPLSLTLFLCIGTSVVATFISSIYLFFYLVIFPIFCFDNQQKNIFFSKLICFHDRTGSNK